jgi:hypothetical protein
MSAKETNVNLSNSIDAMVSDRPLTGVMYDLTIPMRENGEGLTVHCNAAPIPIAGPKLEKHCLLRQTQGQGSSLVSDPHCP